MSGRKLSGIMSDRKGRERELPTGYQFGDAGTWRAPHVNAAERLTPPTHGIDDARADDRTVVIPLRHLIGDAVL